MNFSNELIEKAKAASSAEELLEMAKKEGIELSAADAEMYFSFLAKGSQPLSDEELKLVSGGKGEAKKPKPKYYTGQKLWVGYPTTQNYLGIEVLWPEFYVDDPDAGWRYYVRNEYGLEENYYLDTHKYIKTYKPKGWEDDDKIHLYPSW